MRARCNEKCLGESKGEKVKRKGNYHVASKRVQLKMKEIADGKESHLYNEFFIIKIEGIN